jgi:hypothetical protein
LSLTVLYTGSKAYLFLSSALIVIHFVYFISRFLLFRGRFKVKHAFLSLLFVNVFLAIFLTLSSSFLIPSYQLLADLVLGEGQVSFVDSISKAPNDVRKEAQSSAIRDLRFFGNGAGAPLPSIRNFNKVYLGEFIYLNLIHKYGIFSLPFFYVFFAPLFLSIYFLFSRNCARYSSTSFLLLASSLPFLSGFYTPIVFSPFFLVLLIFISFILDRLSYYRDSIFSCASFDQPLRDRCDEPLVISSGS